MGQVSKLEEARCQCGRYKIVVSYVDSLGQRTRLELKKRPFGTESTTEVFVEPYPEGNRANLLACTECDFADQWPKTLSLKSRKKKSR